MRRRPSRLLFPALLTGLGAGLGLVSAAAAQEVVEPPQYRSNRPYQSEVEAANPEPSRLWVSGGVDVRSQYFYRGYNFVPSGPALQPYATVLYTAYEDDHVRITPYLGAWFDFTEVKGPSNPAHWNEFDAIAGVGVDVGDFTVDFQYIFHTSPSDYFKRFEEIGVDIRYNDDRWWPRSSPIAALNPSVAFFQEIEDKRQATRFDDERNAYIGLGLEPELQPFDVGRIPVTLSFPLTIGGSYNGYYLNDRGGTDQIGYWEAGIKAGIDLPSSRNGPQCRIEAEVDFIRLMADSVEHANGGDSDDVILRVGVKFAL
jgi:hypothetical protein